MTSSSGAFKVLGIHISMKTFKDYQLLTQQALSLIEGEMDLIANLSNISALLNMNMTDINWVGFYLLRDNQLVLGPFQGNVACVRIALDKGVCGKAFSTNTIQRISDVHAFPGHIACDAASSSEIVLPINVDGKTYAVLDIDSPMLDRFTETDQKGLRFFIEQVEQKLGFNACNDLK
tara:strand:- start:22289 stop:22819 length:531 start_codon:yes stop_codon:yes gene_type:complete